MLISLIKDKKLVKIDHRIMVPKEASHMLVEYKSKYEILLDNSDKDSQLVLYARESPGKPIKRVNFNKQIHRILIIASTLPDNHIRSHSFLSFSLCGVQQLLGILGCRPPSFFQTVNAQPSSF
jgi:hypothetical protein